MKKKQSLVRFLLVLLFMIGLESIAKAQRQLKPSFSFEKQTALWLRVNDGLCRNRKAPCYNGTHPLHWHDVSSDHYATIIHGGCILNSPTYFDCPKYYFNFNPILYFNNNNVVNQAVESLVYDHCVQSDKGANGMTWFVVLKPSDEVEREFPIVYDFGDSPQRSYGLMYDRHVAGINAFDLHLEQKMKNHNRGDTPTLLRQEMRFDLKVHKLYADGNKLLISQALSVNEIPCDDQFGSLKTIHQSSQLDRVSFTIGCQSKQQDNFNNSTHSFSGSLAEIIGFGNGLSEQEIDEVESYLALKYGITRNEDISWKPMFRLEGQDLWNEPKFRHNVAGIGRTKHSRLDQRIARSSSFDALITMSTTNDFVSHNGAEDRIILEEGAFIIWGNDGNDASKYEIMEDCPLGFLRISRTWIVHNYGSLHPTYLQLNVKNFPQLLDDAGQLFMLIDKDKNGSFINDRPIPMIEVSDGLYQIPPRLWVDGQRFTFARI